MASTSSDNKRIAKNTVMLWFVLEKLVIPEKRMTATMWVYQFSIIASMVGIISLPYNADIIAHECMGAFAYINSGCHPKIGYCLYARYFSI